MDHQRQVRALLEVLGELGSASVHTVAVLSGKKSTADDVAQAFRLGLAQGLIEPHERGRSGRGLRYRLTRDGLRALYERRPREVEPASTQSVLDVLDDFAGGNIGLVAWKLGGSERTGSPTWSPAIDEVFSSELSCHGRRGRLATSETMDAWRCPSP